MAKGPLHSSAFSHPKAGLWKPKVVQQHHSCLFSQSLSFKCLTITWKLIFHLRQQLSGASMETQTCESYLHTRNQTGRKISKSLTATAFHLPTSQYLSLATLHKSSRHRTQHLFLPGLGLLSGSLWGVRKEGSILAGVLGSNLCCQQSSHSSIVEVLLSPSAGFTPQMFRLKAKIFPASEKQTGPVAPGRTDFCFLWVGAEEFSPFTGQAISSVIWSLLLALYLQFFRESFCEAGHTGDSLSFPPQQQSCTSLYQRHPGAPRWEQECTEAQSALGS